MPLGPFLIGRTRSVGSVLVARLGHSLQTRTGCTRRPKIHHIAPAGRCGCAPACLAALGGSLTFLAGACRLRAGIRRTASRAPFRACRASIGGVRIRASGRPDVEGHDEAGFAGEDGQDIVDRHDDVFRHAVEPCLKLDHVIAHLQTIGGCGRDVEHDLAIAHVSHGQPCATTGLHHQMRRIAVVAAPFVNSADQVGLGGNLGHRGSVSG